MKVKVQIINNVNTIETPMKKPGVKLLEVHKQMELLNRTPVQLKRIKRVRIARSIVTKIVRKENAI